MIQSRQRQMWRRQQALDVRLEAEHRVPREVDQARDDEGDRAEEGHPVWARQREAYWQAAPDVQGANAAEHDPERCCPAVQDRVPGRQERLVDHPMGVGPQVDVEPHDEPGCESGDGPVEPLRRDRR